VKLPVGWPLLALAIGASLVAVYADRNVTAALLFGALALLAVALLFLRPFERVARRPSGPTQEAHPAIPASLLDSFGAGPNGRAEIVLVLDRIERAGGRPELPTTPPAEMGRLRMLSRAEFRRYVEERLTRIEGEFP
jgi:hypothetical protein